MDISASSMGTMASALTQASMGAEVVSKTLDYMHGAGGSSAGVMAITDKQTFGAAVVSKTLDYMNSGGGRSGGMGSMSQTYHFSKDILGGYLAGKGGITDLSV